MVTLPPYPESGVAYDMYSDSTTEPQPRGQLQAWIDQRRQSAASKARMPLILAAQRIGMASGRCDELSDRLEAERVRLQNVPPHVTQGAVEAVRDRCLKLEDALT